MDISVFSFRLRRLREERGLLQKEVADVLGVARGTYANYESGRRVPEAETLGKLAGFFTVSLDYLTGRSEVMRPAAKETEADRTLLSAAGNLSPADREKVLSFIKWLDAQMDAEIDGKDSGRKKS
jgi:transcriptional regulator with XRE-family HTH domain